MNPRSDLNYMAALLSPPTRPRGTQQQISSFMRKLTSEELAEKDRRAQKEREAAKEKAEEKKRKEQAELVSLLCSVICV